jgi:hypothetical protein
MATDFRAAFAVGATVDVEVRRSEDHRQHKMAHSGTPLCYALLFVQLKIQKVNFSIFPNCHPLLFLFVKKKVVSLAKVVSFKISNLI